MLTPLSRLIYDHLLTAAVIPKDDECKLSINRNFRAEQCLLGDHGLLRLKMGGIVQRCDYYITDLPHVSKCPATADEFPCVLVQIPEGNATAGSAEPSTAG
ncbi:hypothetical protein AHF37_05515 [Paragonimus kellicotti]|nr:hypothetical protein AHF37_05515 [Paragonimus kellicotti]